MIFSDLQKMYEHAKIFVVSEGYADEIHWQQNRLNLDFNEADFLRESAWVILCSGFREVRVRKAFNGVSLCFFDWESAKLIVDNVAICIDTALSFFANKRKIEAIAEVANIVNQLGFPDIKVQTIKDPLDSLMGLPFIGPITSRHLAKNLGFNVAKPDRHLSRLARIWGYSDVTEFCESITCSTGDPIAVVDVILWRCCALHRGIAPSLLPKS